MRRFVRSVTGWALLADAIPLYPLYALLFADTGLTGAQISALFAIWSTVGVVAEVPSGALADRFSRRGALAMASVLQGTAYLLWVTVPGFAGFAVGFVLWGLGGSLVSGALEALLYDGLATLGAEDAYPGAAGRVTAAGLVGQVPAAVGGGLLFGAGGYVVVGWASVACCLAAAVLALRLAEPAHPSADDADDLGYVATLRAGVREAARQAPVRFAVIALAALTGLDALEEYLPLLARDWGVPTALNPPALLAVTLAAAAGAALAGAAARVPIAVLAALLGATALALAAAGPARHPALLTVVAVFYGVYRLVLVVVDARLQARVDGRVRATVTSVAALGSEATAFAVYAAWAVGGIVPVALLVVAVAAALPGLLRRSGQPTSTT